MTTGRRSSLEETPFGRWVRQQDSIDSHQHGLVVTDADWIFQKYKTNVDVLGARNVQLMMICEVKTFGATPGASQVETLFFLHQSTCCMRERKRPGGLSPIMLWHFGVFILSIPGNTPVDGHPMYWGSFDSDGSVSWRKTTSVRSLVELLGFVRRPDDPPRKLDLRRHHISKDVQATEFLPILGVSIHKTIKKRS